MMRTVKEFADYANEGAMYEFGKKILDCKEPKEALKDLFTYMHYGLTDDSKFWKELKEDQKEGYLKMWTWYNEPRQPQGFIPTIKGISEIYKYLVNPQSFTIEPFDYQIKEAEAAEAAEKRRVESLPPTEVYKYRAKDDLQLAQFAQRIRNMGYTLSTEGVNEESHIVGRKGTVQVEIWFPKK